MRPVQRQKAGSVCVGKFNWHVVAFLKMARWLFIEGFESRRDCPKQRSCLLGLELRVHCFHPIFEIKAVVVDVQERFQDLVRRCRCKKVRFAQVVGADCQNVEKFVMNVLRVDREGNI